ncbi:MAG: extracellular solute-binding protein [Treponema sp.]|jgi:putative aldouronate transport system substrate-binding protein|nr:extracellular solute-binding protein [Treponema sp.]
MKKTKAVFTVLLALALALPVYAGGGAQGRSGSAAVDRSNFTALGTYPIVKNKETLTVLTHAGSLEADMDQNWMTGWYEEKTNVHVNWQYAPTEQFKERVNLALASGEKLDLIMSNPWAPYGFNQAEIARLANQSLILPVGDLIETDTIHMKANLAGVPLWRETLTQPDGKIYMLPNLSECFHCLYYGKIQVNTEFLKNVGLDYPKTTEDFKQMLIAFRDKDANGNGDPNDEIPFAAATGDFSYKIDTYLMCAFVYDDGENRLFLENGRVVAAFQKPEFREGLKYLNDLYREGLIYRDSFSMNNDTRSKLNSQKYESVIGAIPTNHHGSAGSREAGEPVRWLDYELIAPVKGPKGVQFTRYDPFYKMNNNMLTGTFIPSTSRNAALILRWLDYFHTDEGARMSEFGPKGITWDDPDPGSFGADGTPAAFKTIPWTWAADDPQNPNNRWPGGVNWGQMPPLYRPAAHWGKWQAYDWTQYTDGKGVEAFLYQRTATNYQPYGLPEKDILPPLWYSADEVSDIAMLRTNINTFVDESIAKFVIGSSNINSDADWNNFQAQLKTIGIDRYLQIIQKTYDSSAFAKK